MAQKLIMHIGQQKSGTTYLQEVLGEVAPDLAEEAGILFPSSMREYLPDAIEQHERASYGLLGTEYPWVSADQAERERPKWDRLAQKVADWPGTVLLSAEALSVVRAPAAARIVAELGVPDTEIVVTARGLGKSLPSLWQQHVRNGGASSFGPFLSRLADERGRGLGYLEEDPEAHMWRSFAVGGLMRRWAAVPGVSRVRLVVNPGGDPPDLLWHRFTEAIGVAGFADRPRARKNKTHSGLTSGEAITLLALNKALKEAEWGTFESRALRDSVVKKGMQVRNERGPRIAVPPLWQDTVRRWSEEDLAELSEVDVTVTGDLAELRYEGERGDLKETSVYDVSAAAAAAILTIAASSTSTPLPRTAKPRRFLQRLRTRG